MNKSTHICVPSHSEGRRERFPEIENYFSAAEAECRALLSSEKGNLFSSPEKVMIVDCPVCGSDEFNELFVKWGGLYVQCRHCTHVFVRNMFQPRFLEQLYMHSKSNNLERKIEMLDEDIAYWREVYRKYISRFSSFDYDLNVLDVGAGAGGFARFLREETNFKVSAVELCEEYRSELERIVRPDGRLYWGKSIQDAEIPNERFDLITLWGVLEHLPLPNSTLASIKAALKPNGWCLILVPNLFSFSFRILGIQTPTINPREHINFYTPLSMQNLAEQNGFELISCDYELPVIDLVFPYIQYSEDLIEQIAANGETYYHIYTLKKK